MKGLCLKNKPSPIQEMLISLLSVNELRGQPKFARNYVLCKKVEISY